MRQSFLFTLFLLSIINVYSAGDYLRDADDFSAGFHQQHSLLLTDLSALDDAVDFENLTIFHPDDQRLTYEEMLADGSENTVGEGGVLILHDDDFTVKIFDTAAPVRLSLPLIMPSGCSFAIEWDIKRLSDQIAWTDGNKLSANAPIRLCYKNVNHLYNSRDSWHTFNMPHFPLCIWNTDYATHKFINQKAIITPGVHIMTNGIYFQNETPADVSTLLDRLPLSVLQHFSAILRTDLNTEDFCAQYPMHEDLIQGIIAKGQGLPFIPKPFVKPVSKTLVKLADFIRPEVGCAE